MNYDDIISKVTDEQTLRRKVIMEIFSRMGLRGVKENHGQFEFGKDVIFYRENSGLREYVAVVAKKGNIGASQTNDIIRQVNQCLSLFYPSSIDGNVEIKEVYIITDGDYVGASPITLNGMAELYKKFGFKIHRWGGIELKEMWEKHKDSGVAGPIYYET